MTEPRSDDTFDDDTYEDDTFHDDVDIEAPEGDVIEQHTTAAAERRRAAARDTPLEANDADAAEQDREAGGDDEDEYR
jgi:hypothetical protein